MLDAAETDPRSALLRMFSAISNPEPLAFVLPVLDLISRMARAPKLRRRANGDAGTLEVGASPSSKGDSSTVPEFELDKLSVRGRPLGRNGDVALGDPDRPTVVNDRRRC